MIFFSFNIYILGASYTPEYYINMRTGTHYFPKNVSYGIAEVTNRLKFGLNKIDETHQESNFRNNLVRNLNMQINLKNNN